MKASIPTSTNRRIERAKEFAKKKHGFQVRKDGKTLYWAHLEQVVKNLIFMGIRDKNILCAAWLHDTIEDTNTDFDDLADAFGEDVARIVSQVTKDKRKPEYLREHDYQAQLKEASWQAQVVKLGDIWANIADLESGYKSKIKQKEQIQKKLKYFKSIRKGLSENREHIPRLPETIAEINGILSRYGFAIRI